MEREQELIRRAQAGEAEAFEALFAEYQKRIFSIAYRVAGNAEDAADMAQEVLVKIFRNLNQFRGQSQFSTWVYRVAMNTCLDELKKLRRRAAVSLEQELDSEDGPWGSVFIIDDEPTPDQAALRREERDAVNAAIARLGYDHKRVIILRDIQGFSYEEIAEILQCSQGTVKSRISRARAQLKKILEKDRELFSDYFVKQK